MYNKKINWLGTKLKKYIRKEDGMGVVEVILIVVVLVGLVLVFKDKMTTIVTGMFSSITDGINKVTA
jgi:Flp pilus assembly pilin Flp